MAEVLVKLSFAESDGPLIHSGAYRWLLRTLALWNWAQWQKWQLPSLYSGRVRYGTPSKQVLLDALAIQRQGWADCGPLAAYRMAELWAAGERGPDAKAPWKGGADARIYSRPVGRDRVRLYHAQVRRGPQAGLLTLPTGKRVQKIEDPSRLLGMKAVA